VNLQQLRYFLATCRHGSFTAAADTLFIAQPSVAEQVRRLEHEVGVRLFVRTGRRLELTEAGNTLRTHAERVMAAMDAAEAAMQGARHLRGGTASLGTFGVAERYLVDQLITNFVARHPDVVVRVVGRHSFEVIDRIRNGELEAGLVTLPVDEPTLKVEPVMSDEVLFMSRPGPDTEQPMTIRRLAQLKLIWWPSFSGWKDSIRRQLLSWAEEETVELDASIEVEHIESALKLVEQGLGHSYVLRTIAESTTFPSGLNVVPFERSIYDTYAFVWRKDHSLSPATAELVAMARQLMLSYGQPPQSPAERPSAGEPENVVDERSGHEERG
jgi:DNA-binding transcriptional LysR family regulator